MSEQEKFEAFKIGYECGQQALRVQVEWGATMSALEYWEDYKNGKLTKEGKYVG